MPTEIGEYRTHNGMLAGYDAKGRAWIKGPAPLQKEVAADSPEGAAMIAECRQIASDAGLADYEPEETEVVGDPFAGLSQEAE